MQILIADDDPVFRQILVKTLAKWGYNVIVAKDGNEAWEILQSKEPPKLVILDWVMPGMDGPTICKKLRELPDFKTTYIILLTVRDGKENIVAGLKAGADDYLTKPFDQNELNARIQIGIRMLELHNNKNEIVSIVGHELKSPLASILSALNIVISGDTGELPEQAKRMLEIAQRNSERLLRIINDLMDIKKIESGKMEFNIIPLEISPLVEQAVEANQAYAQQLQVGFLLEDNAPGTIVRVDGDRTIQVINNLLSNAVRFSPPDKKVVVSILNNNDTVRVSVTDNGPGIPEEFRSRIFEKFAQGNYPGARRKGSTGLGLSIAKAIVEAMNGRIGFETRINIGATFYFDLPKYEEVGGVNVG
jgi:signal transduction histidine kinase